MGYHILDGDETRGPYTIGQLRSMWNSGQITGDTLYCEEGYEDWFHLRMLQDQLEQEPVTSVSLRKPKRSSAVGGVLTFCGIILGCVFLLGILFHGLDSSTSEENGGGGNEISMNAELEKQTQSEIDKFTQAGVFTKIEAFKGDQVWVYVSERFQKVTFEDKRVLMAAIYTLHHKRDGVQFLVIMDAYTGKRIGGYSPKAGLNLE